MEMKDLSMHGEDLHGFDVFCDNQEVVVVVGKEDEEIWFETASQHPKNHSHNHNNNDEYLDPSSLFYAEFPALPDFPCKSSSSSSSSNRVPSKRFMTSTTGTSSSASTASSGTASWAMVKSDADHDPSVDTISYPENKPGLGIGGDVGECMDMMEDFGCMDLLDQTSDICWDPSPLFDGGGGGGGQQHHPNETTTMNEDEDEHVFRQLMLQGECNNNNNDGSCYVDLGQTSSGGGGGVKRESTAADELGMVFFEWLKTNKEAVSAEDLRNIKIKKSTIETAAKRLGGGKEGMKQLLKLILQWVQNHHLHANPNPNPNPNNASTTTTSSNVNLGNCVANNNSSTWLTQQFGPDVVGPMGAPPGFAGGYMGGDPYGSGYPPPPIPTWGPQPGGQMPYGVGMGMGMHPYGSFPDPGFGGYGGAGYPAGYYYHPGPGEGLVRLGSSATKEARKKRMARQRRLFTHHHHHSSRSHSNSQHSNNQHGSSPINATVGNGGCGVGASHANWVYWSHPHPHAQLPPVPIPVPVPTSSHLGAGSGPGVGQMAERVGVSGFPRQVVGGVDKKQGWKTEKNLRFLLQKVLKQSDVGNLGRIVLPKKEAEMHLPELEARDGIPIAMEDIGTSRVWNMRYRFWPNNKSRMYLLENTGDFVRTNGLQEGDFIVIYSDVKCGKYMIRGVKVRPQLQGVKPEMKPNNKASKTQKVQESSTPAGNCPTSSLHMML